MTYRAIEESVQVADERLEIARRVAHKKDLEKLAQERVEQNSVDTK